MKISPLQINKLETERLILVPFTTETCQQILNNDFSNIEKSGFKKGISWPDEDMMETIPRIIHNLSKVEAPTGFESWMMIKKESLEIIGDLGFKGFNSEDNSIDIGYGIIQEERRKGYAQEAVTTLMEWAFSNDIVHAITAKCLPDNTASINLLQKLNFVALNKDDEMIYWLRERK